MAEWGAVWGTQCLLGEASYRRRRDCALGSKHDIATSANLCLKEFDAGSVGFPEM